MHCSLRDTVVLATAVMSPKLRDGISYFPLLVDYEERLYTGKIKGCVSLNVKAVPLMKPFSPRMIDRSIRPLFPEQLRNDVQVVITVLSVDQENDPDVLSLIGASCALAMSIFHGTDHSPVHAWASLKGVGAEPNLCCAWKADLDLVVAGTKDRVIMIEAGGNQVTEDKLYDAIEFSQKHTRKVVELIEEVVAAVGSPKKCQPRAKSATKKKPAAQ